MKKLKVALFGMLIIGPAIAVSSNPGKILTSAFKRANPVSSTPPTMRHLGSARTVAWASSKVPLATRSRNIFSSPTTQPFKRNPALAKRKVSTANVGDIVATPKSHPNAFKPFGGKGMMQNKKTKDVFQVSRDNHSRDRIGEYKVGPKPGTSPTKSRKITVQMSNCKVLKRDGC